MKKSLFLILLSALLLPVSFISAQDLGKYTNNPIYLGSLASNIEYALWIIFALIVVVCFVVAGIMFLTAMGDAAKLKTARSAFFWGIAGVAVGIIAYSIVWIMGGLLTY